VLCLLGYRFAVCAGRRASLKVDVVSERVRRVERRVLADVRKKGKSILWRKRREDALFFWES
jgi:hypothetical protein